MSVSIVCDGCGCVCISDQHIKVGQIIQRDYCSSCSDIANNFIREEGELRTSIHKELIERRVAIIEKFSANNFKLPDMP